MKVQLLLILLVLSSTFFHKYAAAHSSFPPASFEDHAHCPCQCRIDQGALRRAREDCYLYSHEECLISFCLNQDRAGFSCCNQDMAVATLDDINAELNTAMSTAEAHLVKENYGFESAAEYAFNHVHGFESSEPHLLDDMYGSESHYLEASPVALDEAHEDTYPCVHMTMSPTVTVSAPASATSTPTASASASATASATPTRTPSTSPSPTATPSVSPSPSPKFATLYYAADNEAFVYVNGVLISALTDWRLFETISFPLKRNDVVAILAKDNGGWYGFIAALHVEERWYVTGRDEWKAIKAFEFPGDDELWTVPFFNTCSWDIVEARPNADVIFNGKAADFPYETGAQYVWADDAGENDSIFVRFVLGGEDCS